MTTLKQQTIHAFKWNFAGNLLVKGGSFIISVVLARLLSPEEFGVLGMAMVFIGISNALVDVGFSSAIVNKQKVSQLQLSTVFYVNLGLSIFLFSLFFLLSSNISAFFGVTSLENVVKVLAFVFVFNAFGQVQRSILTKNMRFDSITIISVIALILSGISAIISSIYGLGIWALVIQQLSLAIFTSLLLWIFSSWKPSFMFSLSSITDLFKYGINLFGATVINNLFFRIDSLIIGKLFSSTSLGLYSRSLSFQNLINTLSTNGLNVLFPAFSKMQDDLPRLQSSFIKIFSIVSLISVILSGFFWLIAQPLFLIMLGDKWILSASYFQILMVVGFVYPCSAIMVHTIKAMGRSDIFLKLDIYKKLIMLPVYIILYFFNITLFLWGMTLVNLVSLGLNMFYLEKVIQVNSSAILKVLTTHCLAIGTIVYALSYLPILNNSYSHILMVGSVYSVFIAVFLHLTQKKQLLALFKLVKNK